MTRRGSRGKAPRTKTDFSTAPPRARKSGKKGLDSHISTAPTKLFAVDGGAPQVKIYNTDSYERIGSIDLREPSGLVEVT
jgi:hypothetical protein